MTSLRTVVAARRMTARAAGALRGTAAPESAPSLTDAALVVDAESGTPRLVYAPVPGGVAELRRAVLGVRSWPARQRKSGLYASARTFGSYPRRAMLGQEGCTPVTHLAAECPEVYAALLGHAGRLGAALAEWVPEPYAAGRAEVEAVRPEWMFGESTWTSGIVNYSTVLPYHRDAGNFRTWSAMPVLRRGVDGGYLHLPEYDLTIPCRDGWVVCFPGYELVHGVTPMAVRQRGGYRFSVVFYALRGMRDCASVALETVRARTARTEREQAIAARLATGAPAIINDYRKTGSLNLAHGQSPARARAASGLVGRDARRGR